MLLYINEKIIKIIKSYGITSDLLGSAIFVLSCLHKQEYLILDLFDNENEDNLSLNVYKDLEIKNLISKTENKKNIYELTTVGKILMQEIFEEAETVIKNSSGKNKNKKPPFDLDWVENWLSLWKNENGIYFKDGTRSLGISLKDAKTRFIGFLTEYSYLFENQEEKESDIIIEATKLYIKEQKKVNFSFSKGAKNFISLVEGNTKDTKTSLLASYCEEYLANLYKNKNLKKEGNSLNAYDTSVNL